MAFDEYIRDLLSSVAHFAPDNFTGIGLIFYAPPLNLPVRSLGDQGLFVPQLPVMGQEVIARVLAQISSPSSPWHDGFHLVDATTFWLTHVCQFISPSIDLLAEPSNGALPVGAREMSAIAASRLSSVYYTALINSQRIQKVYQHGKQVNIEGENRWKTLR